MLATSRPTSTLSSTTNLSNRPLSLSSTARPSNRPVSKDGGKEAIWIPMLSRVSKGKELSEKQLVVLGGTPEQQREFLEQLNPEDLGRKQINTQSNRDRRKLNRQIPVSNKYSLGYTYYDVLDADQEDILARLNVHLLAHPSASFAPLLKPLFTNKTVKETLVVILLDWSDPLVWARQLRQWIRLLRMVILSLDDETKIEMEESMTAWKEKRAGPDASSTSLASTSVLTQTRTNGNNNDTTTTTTTTTSDQKQSQPSRTGPGEWDEGLGLPLCVVCMQAEKIDLLERDCGWQEDHLDFLMQWMRTILLKHGSSLIYTSTYDSNHVRTLVHSSLNIQSTLKRDTVKHNFVDRDKILVPPNWDSWGKISVLNEDFNFQTVGNAWSIEIQKRAEQSPNFRSTLPPDETDTIESAVALFESSLPKTSAGVSLVGGFAGAISATPSSFPSIAKPPEPQPVVTCPPVQEFLQRQYLVLEKLKEEEEARARKARKGAPAPTGGSSGVVTAELQDESNYRGIANARMAEHIGPFSTNVNGIDLNPEEAIRRLKEREADRNNLASGANKDLSSLPQSRSSSVALAGNNTSTMTITTASGSMTPTTFTSASTLNSTPTRPGPIRAETDRGPAKPSNEALKGFFDSLINQNRGRSLNTGAGGPGSGNGSAAASPLRGNLGAGGATPGGKGS